MHAVMTKRTGKASKVKVITPSLHYGLNVSLVYLQTKHVAFARNRFQQKIVGNYPANMRIIELV